MSAEVEKAGPTPGPWEYVPGTEHHGPYVVADYGDVADCYAMSNPVSASVRNGGDSRPINHQGERAEANARLIAAAPDHALVCWAMCAIGARWDGRAGSRKGELCFGGFCYSTELDEFGCPVVNTSIRAALSKAKGVGHG